MSRTFRRVNVPPPYWIKTGKGDKADDRSVHIFYGDSYSADGDKNPPKWFKQLNQRKFRRKSGEGDEVDGKHLGVTVNYHFSLKELKIWTGELK